MVPYITSLPLLAWQVITKSHEEEKQWLWSSTVGSHQYTIREDDGPSLVRGTK